MSHDGYEPVPCAPLGTHVSESSLNRFCPPSLSGFLIEMFLLLDNDRLPGRLDLIWRKQRRNFAHCESNSGAHTPGGIFVSC